MRVGLGYYQRGSPVLIRYLELLICACAGRPGQKRERTWLEGRKGAGSAGAPARPARAKPRQAKR